MATDSFLDNHPDYYDFKKYEVIAFREYKKKLQELFDSFHIVKSKISPQNVNEHLKVQIYIPDNLDETVLDSVWDGIDNIMKGATFSYEIFYFKTDKKKKLQNDLRILLGRRSGHCNMIKSIDNKINEVKEKLQKIEGVED